MKSWLARIRKELDRQQNRCAGLPDRPLTDSENAIELIRRLDDAAARLESLKIWLQEHRDAGNVHARRDLRLLNETLREIRS
jgi:hypothetical protein